MLLFKWGYILSTASVLTILFTFALARFIGLPFFLLILLISLLPLLIGWGCFLAQRGAGWKRLVFLAYVPAIPCALLGGSMLQDPLDAVYVRMRRSGLEEFVRDVRNYERIRNMSDGTRFYKSLNDSLVTYKTTDVDTVMGIRRVQLLDSLLAQEDISPSKYQDFRGRLSHFGFIQFEVQGDIVIFTRDGMLDNCHGIAYSDSGRTPKNTDCGTITSWKHLTGNWYSFTTT